MSDKPQGPGWWLADDGTWHPPELHPSMRVDTSTGEMPDAVATPVETPVTGSAVVESSSDLPGFAPTVGAAPVTQEMPPSVHAAPAPHPASAPVDVPVPVVAAGVPADAPMVGVDMPPLGPLTPRPVPSLDDLPARPTTTGEADHRPEVGPMFPDLFQQAVSGSRLADAITVNFADGEHRDSLDVPQSSGPLGDSQVLVSASARMPAEVGAFTGASAKKRRWHL
jgi:hypothetical protein